MYSTWPTSFGHSCLLITPAFVICSSAFNVTPYPEFFVIDIFSGQTGAVNEFTTPNIRVGYFGKVYLITSYA